MIQVREIHIEEFRGIRDLTLTLDCRSFVIWGPNGSGKSGVVDAIDFALTGNIGRLTGPGTGGLSVLKHGPHVTQRDNAGAARVAVTLRDSESGQTSVLTRSVRSAAAYTLEPDTPEMRSAVEQARAHPELTLSRREIIKYVVAEAGKRAQDVQILLKLDRIDEVRRLLRTAQTNASRTKTMADSEVAAAEDALRRHLDLSDLLTTEITNVINGRREVLGLDALDDVTASSEVAAGVQFSGSAVNKVSAARDIKALIDRLSERDRLESAMGRLQDALTDLDQDPAVLAALRHRGLVELGLQLIDEPACPLCDLEWADMASLREHLQEKLNRHAEAQRLGERLRSSADAITGEARGIRTLVEAAAPHAKAFGSADLAAVLETWRTELARFEGSLGSVEHVIGVRDSLARDPLPIPAGCLDGLRDLAVQVAALPDDSAAVEAASFLAMAQDRWRRVCQARAAQAKAVAIYQTSNAAYETYCAVADGVLTSLYEEIQSEFGEYYRYINSDDEGTFKAELQPAAGKLELEVDFYGQGMFPPAAYHSEGHQDGMGVCLYLALVKRLLGDQFRFAVLDDVVMSVDKNHRRQFCALLKQTFPDVQFIITTHDEVWVRQMQGSGLISRSAQARFHGWTVDDGPHVQQGHDVWEAIAADLALGEVSPAAAKLRRYLEATLGDLAAGLRGQVTYKPENNYDLGDFLSATTGRHASWLKKASASANSWGNTSIKEQVEALKEARQATVLVQQAESWAINPLVHYNEWATLSKADFEPVVDAWRQFFDLFKCSNPDCGSWIYVSGPPGGEDALRCACGTYNLNLLTR